MEAAELIIEVWEGERALRLDAMLEGPGDVSGRGGAVVAPPHPEYGGRLDNPVVVALADGLRRAGLYTLRFNFRGTGRGEGHVSGDPSAADSDYRAALGTLRERVDGSIIAAGYSFGSATAVRVAAADPHVAALVLVAPPLPLLDLPALAGLGRPTHVLIGDADGFSPLPKLRAALADQAHVSLEVIEGADHFFFGGGLERIADLAAAAVG